MGDADALISEVLRQIPVVIGDVGRQLPRDFPAKVSDRVFAGMREQAGRLAGES